MSNVKIFNAIPGLSESSRLVLVSAFCLTTKSAAVVPEAAQHVVR